MLCQQLHPCQAHTLLAQCKITSASLAPHLLIQQGPHHQPAQRQRSGVGALQKCAEHRGAAGRSSGALPTAAARQEMQGGPQRRVGLQQLLLHQRWRAFGLCSRPLAQGGVQLAGVVEAGLPHSRADDAGSGFGTLLPLPLRCRTAGLALLRGQRAQQRSDGRLLGEAALECCERPGLTGACWRKSSSSNQRSGRACTWAGAAEPPRCRAKQCTPVQTVAWHPIRNCNTSPPAGCQRPR